MPDYFKAKMKGVRAIKKRARYDGFDERAEWEMARAYKLGWHDAVRFYVLFGDIRNVNRREWTA